jgi:hypothetical protein
MNTELTKKKNILFFVYVFFFFFFFFVFLCVLSCPPTKFVS